MAAVEVRLLGLAAWQCPGEPAVPLSAKDAALLAKLALDGPQARTVLCELFWPQATPAQAAASLRQRASRLNRAAKLRLIESQDQVRLHALARVDAATLTALPSEALIEAGELLAGLDLGAHDALDRWLAQARARVAASIAQVLADRAERLEREGRLREALPLARRIVELVPLAEHDWRRLMRLHYLRNDRAAAQEAFWRLTSLLRDELGIRPSAETLQLMQTVEAAEAARELPLRPVPASVLRPPALVGRRPAWQAMAAAWQRPQPFLLVGEAGMGKSRLLEDFVAGQPGVFVDRAPPGRAHAPFELLGRVLQQIDAALAPALAPALREELKRLQPQAGGAPAAPAHEAVLRHAIERQLAAAMACGLRAIVLDDLHNVDEATLDTLRWLSAHPALANLRWGLATRPRAPEAIEAILQDWLQDSHRPARIQIDVLSLGDLSDLLASLALPALVDGGIATQLHRHAGGHPLFTLATLQDALTRGEDLRSSHLPRPSSVQALLDARLRTLTPPAMTLLRVAAVAGPDLSADRAAKLLGSPVLALADAWAELEAADILRGEAFSHDLMHESALRAVPLGIRQALSRQLAALLLEEGSAPMARVAAHWEQGERWSEAGRSWQAAAEAARRAGRLAEQIDFFERAARCHAQAGERGAQFDALHARLEALQLCHGGSAVLAALPEAEALADRGERRLRALMARAEAWLDGEHATEAAEACAAALREAAAYPQRAAEAGALHAQALVQCGRFEPALAAAEGALDAARGLGDGWPMLRALEALGYVHYAAGRLVQSAERQRETIALAERLGFHAEAVAAEGNLAALLAAIGDVPATRAQALGVRERYRELGLADDSTLGIVNHVVLGAAAAALGHFEEALDALQAAVATAGPRATPAAQGKARLALAALWLTLGRADSAAALLAELPPGLGPGMQMQARWLQARVARRTGASPQPHLAALGALGAQHPDPPLVQSAWFEWSYQGEARAVRERLAAVRALCARNGLHGTARALAWRELVRGEEIEGAEATAALLDEARRLAPHARDGLSAKCHPPLTWLTLARAFARAGAAGEAEACRQAARAWVEAALERVPREHRQAFASAHPVHRALLGGTAGPA